MRDGWQALVVDRLCELKADGVPFEDAWAMAMRLFPPRGRDLGPAAPALFDVDCVGEPSLVAFFKRACSDAWHGRRPGLQHFHPSLLMDVDRDEPARRRLAGPSPTRMPLRVIYQPMPAGRPQ